MAEAVSLDDLPPFEQLCSMFGLSFPAIESARRQADAKLEELQAALSTARLDLDETSLSLVVFGSMARREWTSGSDVDWTLLIDGPADARHQQFENDIARVLKDNGFAGPGSTATFGALASSHDLVHYVGGLDDSNRNITRRLLLLLESRAALGPVVRNRVLLAVLDRYIVRGRGIPDPALPEFRVPRFLLNDVVRYWRTITVDYAAKKWEQADDRWALRNAKLRLSRKIIFVKGLLLCFDCELFAGASPWCDLSLSSADPLKLLEERQVSGIEKIASLTHIDILSRVLVAIADKGIARRILGPYNDFLDFIDSEDNREHLKTLTFQSAANDERFKRIRYEIGKGFGEALEELFFNGPEPLSRLTQKYGVF